MDLRIPQPSRRHAINALGVVLIAVIVIPFVAFAFPPIVGANGSYVVQSGSMEPAIETGSVIWVTDVDPASIEEGDIITYDLRGSERQVTTHRVVDVIDEEGELRFRTKGDNNEEPDGYLVEASGVIGRVPVFNADITVPGLGHVGEVPAEIPLMGRFIVFAGSRWGIVAFVMIPAGLLIINEVYDLVVAYRAATRQTRESGGESHDD